MVQSGPKPESACFSRLFRLDQYMPPSRPAFSVFGRNVIKSSLKWQFSQLIASKCSFSLLAELTQIFINLCVSTGKMRKNLRKSGIRTNTLHSKHFMERFLHKIVVRMRIQRHGDFGIAMPHYILQGFRVKSRLL